MKNLVLVALISIIGLTSQAQERKNRNAKYDIEVSGNCEQCKKRIEKAAYGVSGVKMAIWDTDDHVLRLIVNEEKTSLADVKKAVAKVGHDADDVKADDEDYRNLHSCCLYKRKP